MFLGIRRLEHHLVEYSKRLGFHSKSFHEIKVLPDGLNISVLAWY